MILNLAMNFCIYIFLSPPTINSVYSQTIAYDISVLERFGVSVTSVACLDPVLLLRERNNLLQFKNIIVLYLQIYNTQNFILFKMTASGSPISASIFL